jgi:hypothetical protein
MKKQERNGCIILRNVVSWIQMKIKQTILALALVVVALIAPLWVGSTVMAETCANVPTAIIGNDLCGGATNTGSDVNNNAVMVILKNVLKIMNIGVGIAAVGGLGYAGLLYTTAADSADQTKKAIGIIRDVIIGLIAYVMMFVLLNFLVPGGVLT